MTDVNTVSTAGPSLSTIERFWKRVAEVTTRYHDSKHQWTGGEEIRLWNLGNRTACEGCEMRKNKRICLVDFDHPSCRPCRANKVLCDRKLRFIFDMTKEQFFPSYSQFLRIFKDRQPGQLRRLRRHENRFKPEDARRIAIPILRSNISSAPSQTRVEGVKDGNLL
ncbi:hypothetical protein B0H13DRAFT_1856536 [Mycena leptocephala]|nr:hypothetical protein B0H13DRAFT_1856536 [Mycena leptocephala]